MKIRLATEKDLLEIMTMYASCVKEMQNKNIYQWDEQYPNSKIIKKDIANNTYYILKKKNIIIAGITIDEIQSPIYNTIKWKDKSGLFLVVHRLGISGNYWGQGIGKKLMSYAEEMVIEKKFKSIRLDTYSKNPIALNFYKSLGYEEMGKIDLKPDKDKYHCFEKIILV